MLTGQPKKDYQREWVRQKRARVRQGSTHSVRPDKIDLKSKLAGVGLKVDKDGVLDATGLTRKPLETSLNSRVPLYRKGISKQGDTVRMPSGEIVVVPELDELGNQIYET